MKQAVGDFPRRHRSFRVAAPRSQYRWAPPRPEGSLRGVSQLWNGRKRGVLVNSTVKTILFWVFILICLMLLWGVVSKGTNMGKEQEFSYSELLDKVQAGLVQDVTIQGTELHGHLKASPKEQFHTMIPANTDSLTKELTAAKVNTNFKDPQSNLLLPIL